MPRNPARQALDWINDSARTYEELMWLCNAFRLPESGCCKRELQDRLRDFVRSERGYEVFGEEIPDFLTDPAGTISPESRPVTV